MQLEGTNQAVSTDMLTSKAQASKRLGIYKNLCLIRAHYISGQTEHKSPRL